MDIKAFIFDLDGVLVFTDKYHYLAWKEVADELDTYFDEEINNRLRGVSRMESLDIILERYEGPALSDEEKVKIATKKNEIYRGLLGQMTRDDVTDDVRNTLKELRKRGIKVALGSSSKNARYILEKVELLDAFDEISDGNNITKSKPDPEVFIKAAQFVNIDSEHCAVVEDAYAGIDAAKAGNMLAFAIGDACGYEKSDIRIDNISDILTYV